MCFFLFFALVLLPAAEIYLIILVGRDVGWFNTALLLVLSGVIGLHYARSLGAEAMWRMRASVEQGVPPAAHMLDGALIMAGGALLVAPGFITDAIGITLLIPASRKQWMIFVLKMIKRKIERGGIRFHRF